MKQLKQLTDDFLNLFYPRLCAACGNTLYHQEEYICTRCLFHLPKTNYHLIRDNPVSQIFWGRVPVEFATSFYEFQKGSNFQKLLHKMKYQNQKEIGWVLGMHFGQTLNRSPIGRKIDIIVPVPLHPQRQRKRGYNQSEWIAKGLAHTMRKQMVSSNLFRSAYTSTQTQKGRYERWQNVEKAFDLHHATQFNNQHILLIDDVVTTGATLEACAHTILKSANSRVSIATLACA